MSEGDLILLEIIAFFGGIVALGWLIRRHIRERHQDKVQWWMREVLPRARQGALWIFGLTMLLWVVVHATAPEDARDDLSRQIEALFKPMLGGDGSEAGEAVPGAPTEAP